MSNEVQFIKNQMTSTQKKLARKDYDWDLLWKEYVQIRDTEQSQAIELRNLLVLKNQPFAFAKAAEYFSKYPGRETDLIGAAFEGLFPAVEAFDLSKGFKFTTYAYWWIRQRISAEIGVGDIKTTAEFRLLRGKAYKILEHYRNQGRDITVQKIAELLDEDLEKVQEALALPIVVSLHEADGDDAEESNSRINMIVAPETWERQLDLIMEEFQDCENIEITHPQLLVMFAKVRNGGQLTEADIVFLDDYNDARFMTNQKPLDRKSKPARRISQARLEKAKELLLNSNWSLMDEVKLSCIDPDNLLQEDVILIENLTLNLV